MSATFSRPYQGEHDYGLMRRLLRSAYSELGPAVGMTIGDLDFWRFQSPDPDQEMSSCRLWFEAEGELIGFAWPGVVPEDDGVIDLFAHPAHAEMKAAMLDYSETWHRTRGRAHTISITVRDGDGAFQDELRRRGYEPTGSPHHWYRVRPIDLPIPDVAAGAYRIRPIEPGDAGAVAEINNVTGASPPLTESSCLNLMAAPTYRRTLSLLAESASMAVAGFCIIWPDLPNRMGLFEPVAVHTDHQGQGLGSALLGSGLQRLAGMGATHALVGTSTTNTAANALYASAGFAESGTARRWQRSV